jgi:hypothetical protein
MFLGTMNICKNMTFFSASVALGHKRGLHNLVTKGEKLICQPKHDINTLKLRYNNIVESLIKELV